MMNLQDTNERFIKTFAKSKEMNEKQMDVIPAGFSRRSFLYGPHAIYADHGQGQYLYTAEGKRLLDLNNNFTVNILGYNNQAVNEAIIKSLEKGYSFGNPSEEEFLLAKMLCERIKSVEKVKFFCSASEACVGAIRMARAYTGKDKFAKLEGGYHGFCDEMAISGHVSQDHDHGPADCPKGVADSAGIPKSTMSNVIVLPQNNFEACEKILRANQNECGCVLIELQAAAGGSVIMKPEFVEKLEALCKELKMVFIIDETGTIRARKGGLPAFYNVDPDLTVMGKLIGGGIPTGAVGGKKEIMDICLDEAIISGTHHAHPMACAAGIATLEQLDDAAYNYLNGMAARIKKELNAWAEKMGYPFAYFGTNSLMGYTISREKVPEIVSVRDYWDTTDENAMLVYALEMAMRGYYPVARGQISLNLPTTEEDITNLIEDSKEVITNIFE